MGLENPNVVDAVGIEMGSGKVVLTIADSWDWANEGAHLLALQAKLNGYFDFVEDGQILSSYPAAAGRSVVIDLVSRFPPPVAAIELLRRAREVAASLTIEIRQITYTGRA